jgi:hypothetical protein
VSCAVSFGRNLDPQISGRADPHRLARQDDSGAIRILDDGRPIDAPLIGQGLAIDHLGCDVSA